MIRSTCKNGWIFYFHNLIATKKINTAFAVLEKELKKHAVKMQHTPGTVNFSANGKDTSFLVIGDDFNFLNIPKGQFISIDQLITAPEKLSGIILSKLKLNRTVFARQCLVKKIDKTVAEEFLSAWHLMGPTQSAYNLGLFYKDELLAAASFTKGRKMNRLPEDKRSFELIRFCCVSGITITGGLTKLLKHFYTDKKAGDIMTYVDKQFSNGSAFVTAGFKKYGESEPNYFLIDKSTFERTSLKDKDADFDTKKFYLTQNSGSIKLVYNPGDTI